MSRRKRREGLSIPPGEFDGLVQRALDSLPEEYARMMKNIAVVIEEEPSRETLEDLDLDASDDLLGLYTGVPMGEETFFSPGGQMPSRVAIYRGPILRLCRTPEEVIQEVRDTVVHEIGHHFGLTDDDMPY
jgi:predicted Zn-dependent protease with MMP-like domain